MSGVPRLVLATRNPHKLREFARLLGDAVEVVPLPAGLPSPEETGETFAENALIKARAAFAATGSPSFADDSGIGAEALGWRPGVYSARYAGPGATDEDNLAKLEAEVPAGGALRYTCVIALAGPDGERLFEGTCDGVMASARSGNRGFGYDPVFELPGGRTLADVSDAEKDAVSHRGRAAAQLRAFLGAGS
jgi:XTP/dITP diphosphohydrolase